MASKYSVVLRVASSSSPSRYGLTARSDEGAKKQGRAFCVKDCLGDGSVEVQRDGVRVGAWLKNDGFPLWVL